MYGHYGALGPSKVMDLLHALDAFLFCWLRDTAIKMCLLLQKTYHDLISGVTL
jgi:hypothetical protein